MRRPTLLQWTERALLTIGVALGAWCAGVVAEQHFYAGLPPPAVAGRVPDPGTPLSAPQPAPLPASPGRPTPARGAWLARLDAPTLHLSAAVLEGSDAGTLRRGAGHIEDTAFPGQTGNVGIAGHRDTIFRPLRHARAGDPLVLTTGDRVYRYEVMRTLVVDPGDVYVLDPTDRPTLTLVTCYPFYFIGHAPRRFIVQARLVGARAQETEAAGR